MEKKVQKDKKQKIYGWMIAQVVGDENEEGDGAGGEGGGSGLEG